MTAQAHGSPPAGADAPRLVNAEAVELDVRPARLGSRAVALLIDIVAEVLVIIVLTLLTRAALPFLAADDALEQAVQIVVVVTAFLAYPTVVETATNGRSLGKAAVGLRVIRVDGGPIRLRHAFTRALVGLAVEWPGLLLPLLTWAGSLTTMLASRRGRRLGDLAAGTLVVHVRRPVPWRLVPGMPRHLDAWASAADLSGVDEELALAVRQYVSRAPELSEPHRGRLAQELAHELSIRVRPLPPAGTPPWFFLVAVLAERRRRAQAQLVAGRVLIDRMLPGFGRRAL